MSSRLNPRCPLCLKPFTDFYDRSRKMMVLVCHLDHIAIDPNDIMVGRWEELYAAQDSKIECIYCNADTRYFCTSTGYWKVKCIQKKCGATMSSVQENGTAHTPTVGFKQ